MDSNVGLIFDLKSVSEYLNCKILTSNQLQISEFQNNICLRIGSSEFNYFDPKGPKIIQNFQEKFEELN